MHLQSHSIREHSFSVLLTGGDFFQKIRGPPFITSGSPHYAGDTHADRSTLNTVSPCCLQEIFPDDTWSVIYHLEIHILSLL